MSVAIGGCGGGAHPVEQRHLDVDYGSADQRQRRGRHVTCPGEPARNRTRAGPGTHWAYSVRVSDAAGRPLSGSVEIEFVFGGQVVGRVTPRSHLVTRDSWHDRLVFPPASVGQPLVFAPSSTPCTAV